MKTRSKSMKLINNIEMKSKSSIKKKISKKENKIIEVDINDNDDIYIKFGKLYAKMISMICNCFIHHDDGACDYDSTGKKRVFKYENTNGMKIMYNPAKPDGIVERAALLLLIPKNIKLNNIKKIKDQINQVNSLLVKDFNNFMELTNNRFYNKIKEENPDQNDILQIYHKFQKNDSNSWILKFNLGECDHYYWNPIQVMKYCKDLENWNWLKHITPEELKEKYGENYIKILPKKYRPKSEIDEEETEDEEEKKDEIEEYTNSDYLDCIKNGPEFEEISLFSSYRKGYKITKAKLTLEV